MPSSITHRLIAEESAERLPEVQELVRRYSDYYFLGAQGGDVYFFYRFLHKKEQNFGQFLHRHRVYDVFSYFARELSSPALQGEARGRVRAYVYGFISHYCADTTFHPFIYNYLEENGDGKFIHQQIEADWDVYFLRTHRGEENERYDFPFSPKKIVREKTLFRLIAGLAQALGREKVTRKKFNAAIKRFYFYLRFFHRKCYASYRRWERTERFFRTKLRISRLFPRSEPDKRYLQNDGFARYSEGRGGNADELFARAVDETVRLVRLFGQTRGNPLPAEEFSKSFLTGRETV